MKRILFILVVFIFIISACSAAPAQPPTATPKPTWTLRPHGTLKACIYKEGELVEGTIRITDSAENTIADRLSVQCVEEMLAPGSYLILGSTYEGEDCSSDATGTVGCMTNGPRIPFEIAVDQVLEIDLDVFPPDQSD